MDILLITLFLIVCSLLIIVVLLQKGRGSGLSGAFGGMGQTAFGTRIGDVFTWVTIILAGVFLLLAITVNKWFHPSREQIGQVLFDPPAMAITETTYVRISAGGPATEIYYTVDGTEPTRRSQQYRMALIPVGPGTLLKARAFRSAWKPSDVATAYYPIPTPTFSPEPNAITAPLEVKIACAAGRAKIHYTTDGSTPTDESPLYVQGISVAPGMTVKARAYLDEGRPSEVAEGEYPLKRPSSQPSTTAPASSPAP
jgi:protein translocase SecG subunit